MKTLVAVVLLFFGSTGLIAASFPSSSDGEPARIEDRAIAGCMGGIIGSIGFAILFVPIYNRLQHARNQCDMAFSNIDVLLQRRHDVLDNLMAIANRYVSHESSVLTSIAQHRSGGDGDIQGRMDEAQIQYSTRLHAVTEAYPQLQADAGFARLTEELQRIESSLANERRDYNGVVLSYNNQIGAVPDVFAAKVLGMRSRAYFKADASAYKSTRFAC